MAREIFEQTGAEFLPAGASLKRLDDLGPTVVRGRVQDRIDAMPGYQKAYIVAGGALATSAMECTDDQKSAAVIAAVFGIPLTFVALSRIRPGERANRAREDLSNKLPKAKDTKEAARIINRFGKGLSAKEKLELAAKLAETLDQDQLKEGLRKKHGKLGNRRTVTYTGYAQRTPEDTRRAEDDAIRAMLEYGEKDPEFLKFVFNQYLEDLRNAGNSPADDKEE